MKEERERERDDGVGHMCTHRVVLDKSVNIDVALTAFNVYRLIDCKS